MFGIRASLRKKFFISATKTTPAPRSIIHTEAFMYMMPSTISAVEIRSNIAGTVSGRNWRRLLSLTVSAVMCRSSSAFPRALRRRRASDIKWIGSANDMARNMIHVWKSRGRNGSSSPESPTASCWKSVFESTVHAVPATRLTMKMSADQPPHWYSV